MFPAGRNPSRPGGPAGRPPLDRVLIAKGAAGPRLQELIALCRERGIPVRFEPRAQLDRGRGGAMHQGIVAFGAAKSIRVAGGDHSGRGLHVVLDGIEDPQHRE